MFGFGKKKLDDRMSGMISIEVAMFMGWMHDNSDNFDPILMMGKLEDIARRILARENFVGGTEAVIALMAMDLYLSELESKTDIVSKSRKQYCFDEQIEKFCKSIGIPMPVVKAKTSSKTSSSTTRVEPPRQNKWVYNKKTGILTRRGTEESYKDSQMTRNPSGFEMMHGKTPWVNNYEIDFE
jgi:hypothetical protein